MPEGTEEIYYIIDLIKTSAWPACACGRPDDGSGQGNLAAPGPCSAPATSAAMRRTCAIQRHLAGGGGGGPAPALVPTTTNAAGGGTQYDTVIRGGQAFNATGHADGTVLDLAITGNLIAAIELPGVIGAGAGATEVDATGLLLTPGLIDMHVHCFTGMTPLGIDPDVWCLGRGCTTVVDAGSAGATTVEGYIRYIAGQSQTRCLSFLNIGMHGLSGTGGAYAHVNQIKVQPAVDAIKKYPEHIVGVKVLLTASYANGGRSEYEALRAGLEATTLAGVPMVANCNINANVFVFSIENADRVDNCP